MPPLTGVPSCGGTEPWRERPRVARENMSRVSFRVVHATVQGVAVRDAMWGRLGVEFGRTSWPSFRPSECPNFLNDLGQILSVHELGAWDTSP